MTTGPYSDAFYAEQGPGSDSSARRLVPMLISRFKPESVVDVGCGTGAWLAEFYRLGITDIRGLDGPWVEPSRLLVPQASFTPVDLSEPVSLSRGFDMCLCLEVAEHIEEVHAEQLVDTLVALAPIVVFSAAIPGQTGVNHVNEQWQGYWASKFTDRSYVAIDCIRPAVWRDRTVQWWYAQNLVVYVRSPMLEERKDLAALASETRHEMLDLVHPEMLAISAPPSRISLPARVAARARRYLPARSSGRRDRPGR